MALSQDLFFRLEPRTALAPGVSGTLPAKLRRQLRGGSAGPTRPREHSMLPPAAVAAMGALEAFRRGQPPPLGRPVSAPRPSSSAGAYRRRLGCVGSASVAASASGAQGALMREYAEREGAGACGSGLSAGALADNGRFGAVGGGVDHHLAFGKRLAGGGREAEGGGGRNDQTGARPASAHGERRPSSGSSVCSFVGGAAAPAGPRPATAGGSGRHAAMGGAARRRCADWAPHATAGRQALADDGAQSDGGGDEPSEGDVDALDGGGWAGAAGGWPPGARRASRELALRAPRTAFDGGARDRSVSPSGRRAARGSSRPASARPARAHGAPHAGWLAESRATLIGVTAAQRAAAERAAEEAARAARGGRAAGAGEDSTIREIRHSLRKVDYLMERVVCAPPARPPRAPRADLTCGGGGGRGRRPPGARSTRRQTDKSPRPCLCAMEEEGGRGKGAGDLCLLCAPSRHADSRARLPSPLLPPLPPPPPVCPVPAIALAPLPLPLPRPPCPAPPPPPSPSER